MSRCFPFPPPGYEKKPRSDDVLDLLTKEKDKKKKHKKDKRNKEKQDGKERKHNGKSKDKHKEKKDRKKKHKEKRRHKDRDKEKIAGIQIEERVQGQNENKVRDSSKNMGEVKDSLFTEELAKRYKGDGVTNRMSDNSNSSLHASEGCRLRNSMEKERLNEMEMVVNNTSKHQNKNDGSCKYSGQTTQRNKISEEMPPLDTNIGNRVNKKHNEGGKSMEKRLNQRNAKENQALDKYDIDTGDSLKDQRKCNVSGQLMQKGAEMTGWKEANDKQKLAQLIVKCQTNNERMHQTSGDVKKHIEESEKPKVSEVGCGMPNHHRHKDLEEKKLKKDNEKGKKELEKVENDKHIHKHKGHVQTDDIQEQRQLGTQCIDAIKDKEKHIDSEENLKKRKDQMKNGFFNEIDLRPNKLPRPIENGRMIEPCYLPAPSPNKLGDVNSNIAEHKALDKSKWMNGAHSVDSTCSVPADTRQHDRVSFKAPHPDSKYLDTVYSVPKMEGWLEFDNQAWLFQSDVSQLKSKTNAMIDEMVPQVWSEGWKIESADVFSLPYVIPY